MVIISLLFKKHYIYYFQILDLTFFQLITVISYTVVTYPQNVSQQQINGRCYNKTNSPTKS